MIEIRPGIVIDDSELSYEFARSSGPGGQNVNKVNTRVTLLFDVNASAALDDHQKGLVHRRLATRINKLGVMRVTCQAGRSQLKNKEDAISRFVELLRQALTEQPKRFDTKVPFGERKKRLENKKRTSEIKRTRNVRDFD
jgi:ribosome-associated protein